MKTYLYASSILSIIFVDKITKLRLIVTYFIDSTVDNGESQEFSDAETHFQMELTNNRLNFSIMLVMKCRNQKFARSMQI